MEFLTNCMNGNERNIVILLGTILIIFQCVKQLIANLLGIDVG